MNKSTFMKAAAALGVAVSLAAPASAQVSTGLQQAAFGGTVTGDVLSGNATGFSALSNVAGTRVQGGTIDANGTITGGTTVTTSGGGGKVGTFQASLSEGDQQRFAVGTSTNIGVSASSTSTSEYVASSAATFGVGTSNLKQTIGTSGVSESATARSSAATSYADTSVGSSASSYFEKAKSEIAIDSTKATKYSWWQSSMASQTYDQAKTNTTSGSQIDTTYDTAYGNAKSEYSSSSASTEAANGVISGSFVSSSNQVGSPATSEAANNQVTVKGIGNAANVNAMSNSNFSSVITARSNVIPPTGSSGTASGSAGANVSSTASADAAATKFSSVFIQSY